MPGIENTSGGADVARKTRTDRFALLLWSSPPLGALPCVVIMCASFEEIARAALFGSPGTEIVIAAVWIVVVVATVLAWRGVEGTTRTAAAGALFVSVVLLTALLIEFLVKGSDVIGLAILMTHSTASIAVIAAQACAAPLAGRTA